MPLVLLVLLNYVSPNSRGARGLILRMFEGLRPCGLRELWQVKKSFQAP